jgi:3-isopropylmalate/(R)-2-methylmalate dehydratase small subunit
MQPFTVLTSKIVALPNKDVDTDQIIPARYLRVTDKAGLAEGLFASWRYQADGSPNPDFPLNRPQAQGAQILLAGDNFGCGSSREHAPWALLGWGFRLVVSTSFADIFYNNSLKNGLLPVRLDAEAHTRLFRLVEAQPESLATVDLPEQTLGLPGFLESFPIDAFNKTCLINGFDQLGYLLQFDEQITAYERLRKSL